MGSEMVFPFWYAPGPFTEGFIGWVAYTFKTSVKSSLEYLLVHMVGLGVRYPINIGPGTTFNLAEALGALFDDHIKFFHIYADFARGVLSLILPWKPILPNSCIMISYTFALS